MRLIDADELYPDCMTKNGTAFTTQFKIVEEL